jgi:hypothetical protein
MQDTRTGELKQLSFEDDSSRKFLSGEVQNVWELKRVEEAGLAAGIPKQHQGPVFRVGEMLDVKGGKFRVRSFGHRCLVLEGIPGTHASAVEGI